MGLALGVFTASQSAMHRLSAFALLAVGTAAASATAGRCPVSTLPLQRRSSPLHRLGASSRSAVAATDTLSFCCDACAALGSSQCASFSWSVETGVCLLHHSSAKLGDSHEEEGTAKSDGAPWLCAGTGSYPTLATCDANATAADLIAALRETTNHLLLVVYDFWNIHGRDSAGGCHTTLDDTGKPHPPFAKTLRGQAEDLQGFAEAASRLRFFNNASLAAAATSMADAQCDTVRAMLDSQAEIDGKSPVLFATRAQAALGLATYARVAANKTSAREALQLSTAQAGALLACCRDEQGGFRPQEELREGWYAASARYPLSTHVLALSLFAAHRNASARLGVAEPPAFSSALAGLLQVTADRFVVRTNDSALFSPDFLDERYAPIPSAVFDYGSTLGLLSAIATLAALPGALHGHVALNRSLAAAATAADQGFDSRFGGFFSSGSPLGGGLPSSLQKTYYAQLGASGGLVWLWRLTGDSGYLCKALATLRRLERRQLAPIGEFFWATIDGESDGEGPAAPVGMHGSMLAEPWKGAGTLSSLATLGAELDEIRDAEIERWHAAPGATRDSAWAVRAAPRPAAQARQLSPACERFHVALPSSTPSIAAHPKGVPMSMPPGASTVLRSDNAGDCCAACEAQPYCASFLFAASQQLCALRPARRGSPAAPPAGWTEAALSRQPMSVTLAPSCPSALPALMLSRPVSALAGQAGKAGPGGEQKTAVVLRAASCAGSSAEAIGGAHLRGESSRRDYLKKSVAMDLSKKAKNRSSDGKTLCAVLGGAACDASWVLGAEFDDCSGGLRDALVFNRSAALGLWAPSTQPVDLFSSSGYEGLYWLTGRPDSTAHLSNGSFVVSFDPWDEGEGNVFVPLPPSLPSSRLRLSSPRKGNETRARVAAAAAAMARLGETAGNSSTPCDWRGLIGDVIDAKSWVTAFMLTEWSNDPDSYAKSVFLSLDASGRLAWGPLWDKGQAFGTNANSATEGLRALSPCAASCDVLENNGTVLGRLARFCPPFMRAVGELWKEARASPTAPLGDATVNGLLHGWARRFKESGAIARDRKRWGACGGGGDERYDADVDALSGWIRKRAHWLDSALAKEC